MDGATIKIFITYVGYKNVAENFRKQRNMVYYIWRVVTQLGVIDYIWRELIRRSQRGYICRGILAQLIMTGYI